MHLLFAAAAMAAMPLTAALLDDVLATTPVLRWQNVSSVRALCLVAPDTLPRRRETQAALCQRVAALASIGSPMPVTTIGFGDPAILDRNTVTLLVHATVEPSVAGEGTVIAFSIRAFRNAGADTESFFGAAPRVVRLAGAALAGPALDTAIDAALGDVVPWKQARR